MCIQIAGFRTGQVLISYCEQNGPEKKKKKLNTQLKSIQLLGSGEPRGFV